MMSIETKVDGNLINYAHAVRKEKLLDGSYTYKIEYFRPGKDVGVLRFKVEHKREEGAEKLALLISQEVNKLLGGK